MTDTLITFVLQGRNDNYMDDYLYRLNTSLAMLARSLDAIGQLHRAEILFVDWGSAVPLAEVVSVTPEVSAILEFIHVPPDRALRAMPSGKLYTTLMVNIGVRRARGRYVMLTDTDNLWTETAVRLLFGLLDGQTAKAFDPARTCFSIKRYQVPWELARRQPSVAQLDRYLTLCSFGFSHEAPEAIAVGGFAAGQLMHRDLWFDLRGYDEGLQRAALWADNDLFLRASQRHPWHDTSGYGVVAYHIEHRSTLQPPKPRPGDSVNLMTYHPDYTVNGPDWGWGGEDLPRLRTRPKPTSTGFLPLRTHWKTWADVVAGVAAETMGALLERLGLHVDMKPDDTANPLSPVRIERLVAWLRRSYGEQAVRGDGQHRDLALVLVTFSQMNHPRRVHHFGHLDAFVAWLLCLGSPNAELYLDTPWPYGVLDDKPMHPGLFSALLTMSRFRGYTRVLSAAGRQMFEMLTDADAVELAVLDAPTMGDDVALTVQSCESRLEPGGMVLILGAKHSSLSPVLPDNLELVSPDGLILRIRPAMPPQNQDETR